jgi:serine/threonine protein phosphatase PrpC
MYMSDVFAGKIAIEMSETAEQAENNRENNGIDDVTTYDLHTNEQAEIEREHHEYLDDRSRPPGPTGPRHYYFYDHPATISKRINIGAASDENLVHRLDMEDALTVMPLLTVNSRLYTYMAVFDGHCGRGAAEWCRRHFHEVLVNELQDISTEENREGADTSDDVGKTELALKKTFEKADEMVMDAVHEICGCNVAMCLIDWKSSILYSANCGEARVVLLSGVKTIRLSHNHRNSDPLEEVAVHNNHFNMTRIIGKRSLKPIVSSEPFVTARRLTLSDSVVVIATDGLWDVVGDQTASVMAWHHMSYTHKSPKNCTLAANSLIDRARCTKDNVSVIVCEIDMSKPIEEDAVTLVETENHGKVTEYIYCKKSSEEGEDEWPWMKIKGDSLDGSDISEDDT